MTLIPSRCASMQFNYMAVWPDISTFTSDGYMSLAAVAVHFSCRVTSVRLR